MSGTHPLSILARPRHWPRFIRWASVALSIVCLSFLAFAVLHQDPTLKVIKLVGGELSAPFNDGTASRQFRAYFRSILRDPYAKDLYLGPRDLRQDSFHQVYNEQLRDEEILQIELSRLGHLRIVDLSGPNVTDQGFAHIVGNRQVHNASCRRAKVTDAGLAAIVENTSMMFLDVSGNAITDRGISSLARMNSLNFVSLNDTLITSDGLRELVTNRVKWSGIDVSSTDVTDEGLALLSSLPRLRSVQVDVTQCSDIGIAHLQNGKNPLTSLVVSTCSARKQSRLRQSGSETIGQIDDELIARISQIKSIEWFGTRGTGNRDQAALTPAMIKNLQSMPALIGFSISGIQVDPEVVKRIRQAMPVLQLKLTPAE